MEDLFEIGLHLNIWQISINIFVFKIRNKY